MVALIYLTKVTANTNKPGRAGEEVEVTPEMIDAGVSVLVSSGRVDEYSRGDRVLVAQIFEAMYLRRP